MAIDTHQNVNARMSSHVLAFQDAYAAAPMVSSAQLFVCSTISSTMSGVKYSSKTSSRSYRGCEGMYSRCY